MTNTLSLSIRGTNAPASPIRELVPIAQAAKNRGIQIYHLNIGDPDFPLPDEIQQTLKQVAQDITKLPYPAFRGQPSLLTAWRTYYQNIGIPTELSDENIIVTAGASDAMVLITATITDPGDDILVFEPFYAPYQSYASFLSVNLVPVPLDKEQGYHLPEKDVIEKQITPKTKAIFFTNPNNPTGTVYTREEIACVLAIAKEHNLFVVCDETYRGIAFEGRESLSALHVATEADLPHIIIADSLSKRLNVCGARMGTVVSKNQEFVTAAFRFTQGRPYAALIEQEIVASLLTHCNEYVSWLAQEYQKRRDAFIPQLKSELEIKLPPPEGAFYAMVPLPIDDASVFAKWLLTDFSVDNQTVMISPGSGFYKTQGKGTNEIRVAYVLGEAELTKAAKLLGLAVKQYNQEKK